MELYEQQPTRYPPTNWRKPPPAGYIDAHGMRRESQEPWRPVGLPTVSTPGRPCTPLPLPSCQTLGRQLPKWLMLTGSMCWNRATIKAWHLAKVRKAVLVGCNLHAMHYICNWAFPSHTALSCESMHLGFDCLHEGHL